MAIVIPLNQNNRILSTNISIFNSEFTTNKCSKIPTTRNGIFTCINIVFNIANIACKEDDISLIFQCTHKPQNLCWMLINPTINHVIDSLLKKSCISSLKNSQINLDIVAIKSNEHEYFKREDHVLDLGCKWLAVTKFNPSTIAKNIMQPQTTGAMNYNYNCNYNGNVVLNMCWLQYRPKPNHLLESKTLICDILNKNIKTRYSSTIVNPMQMLQYIEEISNIKMKDLFHLIEHSSDSIMFVPTMTNTLAKWRTNLCLGGIEFDEDGDCEISPMCISPEFTEEVVTDYAHDVRFRIHFLKSKYYSSNIFKRMACNNIHICDNYLYTEKGYKTLNRITMTMNGSILIDNTKHHSVDMIIASCISFVTINGCMIFGPKPITNYLSRNSIQSFPYQIQTNTILLFFNGKHENPSEETVSKCRGFFVMMEIKFNSMEGEPVVKSYYLNPNVRAMNCGLRMLFLQDSYNSMIKQC
jgi:hypothetical protein